MASFSLSQPLRALNIYHCTIVHYAYFAQSVKYSICGHQVLECDSVKLGPVRRAGQENPILGDWNGLRSCVVMVRRTMRRASAAVRTSSSIRWARG